MDKENGSIVYGIEFSKCIWEEFQEKGQSNVYLTKWRKKTVPFFMRNVNFYPNIRNEKSTELVYFEQKVLRLNERYIKSTQEIINWHESPVERRMYPESFKQNWTSFKQKAKKYALDKTHGILFRLVKNFWWIM